jgi:formate--tetrahydrofolate ligase
MSTFPSDIEIAQNATMSHIKKIAEKINISRRRFRILRKV